MLAFRWIFLKTGEREGRQSTFQGWIRALREFRPDHPEASLGLVRRGRVWAGQIIQDAFFTIKILSPGVIAHIPRGICDTNSTAKE